MLKKLLELLRKFKKSTVPGTVPDAKTLLDTDNDNIFPDAKTLRQETLENTPFITDEQILEKIREAQKKHDNFVSVSNFRISEESIAKLREKGISVRIMTIYIGFNLEW